MLSHFHRVRLFATLWTEPAKLLCPWDSLGKNTGVDCHALLQGIFPTQESNPCLLQLLHCMHSLLLSHQESLQLIYSNYLNKIRASLVGQTVKNLPATRRPVGLFPISGLGRSPGEGHGNPLQYSCLENPMDRGAWWATVHGVTESQTQLSN